MKKSTNERSGSHDKPRFDSLIPRPGLGRHLPGDLALCARLTLQRAQTKSNGKVSGVAPSLYAQWRDLALTAPVLREAEEAAPSERLLQRIWHHLRLQRDQLRTLDGRKVRVLHPGFW